MEIHTSVEIKDARLDVSPVSIRLFYEVLRTFPPLPFKPSLLLQEFALRHGLQLGPDELQEGFDAFLQIRGVPLALDQNPYAKMDLPR